MDEEVVRFGESWLAQREASRSKRKSANLGSSE